MKERLKKLAPWIGFPIFYLFCLVLFATWTFPYDKVKERAVLTFNQQQRDSGGQQELKIEEMSSYRLTGATAKGVHLIGPPPEAGKPPSDLKIDEVKARLAILPLILFNVDVPFKVSAFGGSLDGTYGDHGKEKRIELTIEDVDIGQVDPLTQMIGVPLEGKINGEIKLAMPEGKASKANGSVQLEAKDVAVGDGKAKLKGQLALPRVNVGTLTISGEAKEGILRISKLGAGGKDLELQGDGRVQLREALGESMSDLNIRFKVNDGYRTKSDITKSLFGAPGSTMPALFNLNPKVKQSKRQDGFYGWHMRGQVGKPEFNPAPFASGSGAPGSGIKANP